MFRRICNDASLSCQYRKHFQPGHNVQRIHSRMFSNFDYFWIIHKIFPLINFWSFKSVEFQSTHLGLVASIDAAAPFSIPALVFRGGKDPFGPMAPELASKAWWSNFLSIPHFHTTVTSTHHFHTRAAPLLSSHNPSVTHKSISSSRLHQFHTSLPHQKPKKPNNSIYKTFCHLILYSLSAKKL